MNLTNRAWLPLILLYVFLYCMVASMQGQSQAGAVIFVSIKGEVKVRKVDSEDYLPPADVAVGKSINEGYVVETGADSKVVLLFSTGSLTTLEGKSKMEIKKFFQKEFEGNPKRLTELQEEVSDSEVKLNLNYGDLTFRVKKLRPGSSFEIESPIGSAGIRGTTGNINVQQDPNTQAYTGSFGLIEGNAVFTDQSGGVSNVGGGQAVQAQATSDGQQIGTTETVALNQEQTEAVAQSDSESAEAAENITVEQLVEAYEETGERIKSESTPAPSEGNETPKDEDTPEEEGKDDSAAAETDPKEEVVAVAKEVATGAAEGTVTATVSTDQLPAEVAAIIEGVTNEIAAEVLQIAEKLDLDKTAALSATITGSVEGSVAAATLIGASEDVIDSVGEAAANISEDIASELVDVTLAEVLADADPQQVISEAVTPDPADAVDIDTAMEVTAGLQAQPEPFIIDSDGDGLGDSLEKQLGSDPNNRDSDGDLLMDGYEYIVHGLEPGEADSDGDGISDSVELGIGTDPHTVDSLGLDSDYDGIPDNYEVLVGTDPQNPDTDKDGWYDGFEVGVGSNPLVNDVFIVPTTYTVSPIAPGEPFNWRTTNKPQKEILWSLNPR